MKGSVKAQLGFGDEVLGARADGNAVLERMNALTPWAAIAAVLDSAYLASGGRPSHAPLVLFKMTLLQHLYNLSDPQAEAPRCVSRLSFMRFVGLGLADALPDETALVRFRARLAQAGIEQRALDLLNAKLERERLIIKRGSLAGCQLRAIGRQARWRCPQHGRWPSQGQARLQAAREGGSGQRPDQKAGGHPGQRTRWRRGRTTDQRGRRPSAGRPGL